MDDNPFPARPDLAIATLKKRGFPVPLCGAFCAGEHLAAEITAGQAA
jgi:hypothetical protein